MNHLKILLVVLMLAPWNSFAAEAYSNVNQDAPLFYSTLIPMPNADGSPQQKKEIQYILELQKNVNPQDIRESEDERNITPEMILGPEFTRNAYPALYNLMDRAGETSRSITDTAKNYWKTDRPYLVDSRIKPLIEPHSNYSYPSGHTSGSYTWAYVASMILPLRTDEFHARAEKIAQHRVLVGMHFPSDIEGGKKLALFIVGGLLQNPQFYEDFIKAHNEMYPTPSHKSAE